MISFTLIYSRMLYDFNFFKWRNDDKKKDTKGENERRYSFYSLKLHLQWAHVFLNFTIDCYTNNSCQKANQLRDQHKDNDHKKDQKPLPFLLELVLHVPYLFLSLFCPLYLFWSLYLFTYTVRKKIKCCWNSEIIHKLVRDTSRKSEKHELIRALSWNNPCSISESPLQFISFVSSCFQTKRVLKLISTLCAHLCPLYIN